MKEEQRDQLFYKRFRIDVNGCESIPGILVDPISGQSGKLLLFIHGLGGKKEDVELFRDVSEPFGFTMLAIDARGHGDRMLDFSKIQAKELLEVLSGTILDNRIAIDVAFENGWAREGMVVLAGVSMGGILGGVIAGVDDRIAGAALYVAGGDLINVLKRSKHPVVSQIVKGVPKFMFKMFKRQLDSVDPINFVEKISPRPLLLQLAKNDEYVPFDCGMKLFERAREPKDLVVHESGHELPREKAILETKSWMKKRMQRLISN
ncbi:MAG: alpha/beta hydrolase family protein [Thermoproteota archaeon]